jgi:acyl carrier protein
MAELAEIDFAVQLMNFVCENFTHAKADDLNADDPLLDAGIVDSLGLLEIVEFIEAQFGVTVTLTDMSPENFRTINAMAGFVARSTAGAR